MSDGGVMTVRGPLPVDQLGITLMHEHIFNNMMREFRLEGLMSDFPLAVHEISRFREAGGRSIVDLTNASLGRQPAALRAISEATGVNIILGCGLYRHQYYDADWVDGMSTNDLADWLVTELTDGIGDTGVRAGIIGEIGCDEWLTAQEERVFRAAARAQRKTGVALSTHAARWPVGIAQIDLLVGEERVDPRRVIIGHCDTVTNVAWTSPEDVLGYHEELARRGVYVEFDTLRIEHPYDMEKRVRYVTNLVRKGYLEQILLSHDVTWRSALRTFGGGGYDFVLTDFGPRLEAEGISPDEIRTMLVDNPRRALAGA
jgi:predicted metal-dependent phosphotriesterase family hydrolase